jgi:hypothetical protein
MNTYQQIHEFTAEGAARFAAFLASSARPGVDADACRIECLGVIEDNLNSRTGGPLAWQLGEQESADGNPVMFTASQDDLIIEVVTPDE